jgi:DNA polymerase delta subunit 1
MKRALSKSSIHQIARKRVHLDSWYRKPALSLDPDNKPLLFQQTSIEWSMDKEGQVPIIHIYGTTEEGNSILCHIHGFLPYAFLAVPDDFDEDDLPYFKQHLFNQLGEDCVVVKECEVVQHRSLYGYNKEAMFIKVTLTNPYKLSKLNDIVKDHQTFESNLDFILRFMVDMKIVGMNWIELPAGSYHTHLQDSTYCQYEVDIPYDQIISHPPEDQMSTIAPLRILSFDIKSSRSLISSRYMEKESLVQKLSLPWEGAQI